MIRKCDAIADDKKAADRAHLPIQQLAAMGCVDEAIRSVNRFLRRLRRNGSAVVQLVRMAKLGAQLCLSVDDLVRTEHFLEVAVLSEHLNTRKCDQGFSVDSVREFRAKNGLLDPNDAITEEERLTAQFERARRHYNAAKAAGRRKLAKTAIAEMAVTSRRVKTDWQRQSFLKSVIECYVQVKDYQEVRRFLRRFNMADRYAVLTPSLLVGIGMKAQGITRARKEIAGQLKELRKLNNPNIHVPVMAIANMLEFLVGQGEMDEARRWLRRTCQGVRKVQKVSIGWTTSSVYYSLAKAVAMIDGPAVAQNLLEQSIADAMNEARGDFREGAVNAILLLKASFGRLNEAIDDARKLNPSAQRRLLLARLLARARRWTELGRVLSEVKSPEEAAHVAWWIKFELPGGSV